MRKKCKKSISILILTVLLSMLLFSLYGCTKNPDDYTTEEHIEMISKEVQKKYIDKDDSLYNSFAVYPLYSINETVCMYLVEFEPYGFLLIKPYKEPYSCFVHTSMYRFDDSYMLRTGRPWRRYRFGTEDCPPEPFNEYGVKPADRQRFQSEKIEYYELSESGNFIDYQKSPYAIANVLDQKLYVEGASFVIKKDDKYLNVVSMLLYDEDVIKGSEFLVFTFIAGSVKML